MRTKWLTCEANKKHRAKHLYQRDTDGLFVCAPCVPSSTWRRYPKPREQRALALRLLEMARRKSIQAKNNFGGNHK